ncbi:hypothetical protein HN419_07425 [Candidatus Woesearchaeota archaeon]|nr:hypothetical protein [Candidatus Woesearchaeota archaeon]MBT3538324.1 hypothetical protein [Candidatus Woesearchaeota archaeon]MBT4698301.1 hypothetical protein [Candidatus Woesearchaeota archaeon]MBT4716800.1 hypothetical protein [Candidatus Woesearchaeota archaeon]MBT7105993.1 hypothetical protein [Candidatus Woesearchaeota archaeon]
MVNRIQVVIGSVIAAIGLAATVYGAGAPNYKEMDLMHETAEYVMQYEGEHYERAVDYAQTTLQIVQEANENFTDASELETTVAEMKEVVASTESDAVKQHTTHAVGEQLEELADNYDGSFARTIGTGMMSGGLCFAVLGLLSDDW